MLNINKSLALKKGLSGERHGELAIGFACSTGKKSDQSQSFPPLCSITPTFAKGVDLLILAEAKKIQTNPGEIG
jgi:hypothetical protein